MQDKFTGGEWSAIKTADQMNFEDTTVCPIKYRGNDDTWFVGSTATNHGDPEATARLIAAAPDLLSACRLAMGSLLSTEAGYKECRSAIEKAIYGSSKPAGIGHPVPNMKRRFPDELKKYDGGDDEVTQAVENNEGPKTPSAEVAQAQASE